MTSTYLFAYVSSFSVILPFIGSIIVFKSLNSNLRLFSLYLFITLAKEGICVYLANFGMPNLYIYNILGILAYLIYFYLYYHEFTEKITKKTIAYFSVITSTVYLIDLLAVNGFEKFNTLTTTFGGLFLTITALLYFYHLIKNIEHSNLTRVPMFWISTGVLFYSVGTIILFNYFNAYIHLPPSIRSSIWTINSVLNILQNILLTIGIFCNLQNRTYYN